MSNLEIVLKKSGELRVYCDLREVNNAVIRESCVLPKVDDTLQAMCGSKIDAKSSFFQLSFTEEFRYVTTLITPRGCYKFKRIPFGPGDASEVFQKMMEEICLKSTEYRNRSTMLLYSPPRWQSLSTDSVKFSTNATRKT